MYADLEAGAIKERKAKIYPELSSYCTLSHSCRPIYSLIYCTVFIIYLCDV
jgi:hypothetical protein